MAGAACRGMDPETFHPFPGDREGLAAARAICDRCEVAEECLAWAVEHHESQGVWGGASARERQTLRQSPCPVCGQRFLELRRHLSAAHRQALAG